MIGPFTDFADLAARFDKMPEPPGPRYGAPPGLVDLPPQAELDEHAAAVGREFGITFEPGEAIGQYTVTIVGDEERKLERWRLYALATPGEVLDAVRAFIVRLHEAFGPGRVWTLAGRVHAIRDDDAIVCSNVDGVRHVNLRAFFCHENGPRAL